MHANDTAFYLKFRYGILSDIQYLQERYNMERLSARLNEHEFNDLDNLGGKTRTENTRLAIKYAKKYKKMMDKKNGKSNTKHKKKKA